MAEYIEREKLLNELLEELDVEFSMHTEEQNKMINSGLRIAIKDIKHLPTADVQEVVRCKDCEYRKTEDCAMQYDCECGAHYFWESDNAFCSRGKRKENGIDDE